MRKQSQVGECKSHLQPPGVIGRRAVMISKWCIEMSFYNMISKSCIEMSFYNIIASAVGSKYSAAE